MILRLTTMYENGKPPLSPLGERVAHDGVFVSRRGPGEGVPIFMAENLCTTATKFLIEVRRPVRVAIMFKEPRNLLRCDSRHGKLRQRILHEKPRLCLRAAGRDFA